MCQVSGSRAVDKKGCQDSDMSEASQIKRLLHHQPKMSGMQKCKGQRLLRDHTADGRASQAVSGCSYRPSLVLIGSSPSRNFRHPACPGSTCTTAVGGPLQDKPVSVQLLMAGAKGFDDSYQRNSSDKEPHPRVDERLVAAK